MTAGRIKDAIVAALFLWTACNGGDCHSSLTKGS